MSLGNRSDCHSGPNLSARFKGQVRSSGCGFVSSSGRDIQGAIFDLSLKPSLLKGENIPAQATFATLRRALVWRLI
jgi:hypothetical protein